MKMIRLAAFAVAVAAAAMSIGSAGASTATSVQTVDLSTDQAVVSYLTSLGIDPAGVVIQRGARDEACPSCERFKRAFQKANGNSGQIRPSGPSCPLLERFGGV